MLLGADIIIPSVCTLREVASFSASSRKYIPPSMEHAVEITRKIYRNKRTDYSGTLIRVIVFYLLDSIRKMILLAESNPRCLKLVLKISVFFLQVSNYFSEGVQIISYYIPKLFSMPLDFQQLTYTVHLFHHR